MPRSIHALSVVFLLLAPVSGLTAAPAKVDYSSEIKPILERSCYGCHGAKAQMGGLRLDSRKLSFQGGQSGKAGLVAGKPGDSALYQRVAGLSDQARMPMGSPPLPADQTEKIRTWIEQGAEWPEDGAATSAAAGIKKHWAFIAPVRPALPAVKNPSWGRTPVDAFVLARLEREGLRPSPEADRTTLIRRLSLDLTGLPPTAEEVDRFVKDPSRKAYEKLVARLLESPHYGERWGRHWLDAARYADSDGFEKDKQRAVYFYRDWVVNAFNRDLPYDRFIIEQLAGDLLPNPTQDQLVATGFLRNSMINEEGGIDPEQFRMEAMFDRMDAIGKSVLGLTINCAQCHNHKYDPFTQEDYYRVLATLNNAHEANVAVYTAEEQIARQKVLNQIRDVEAQIQHAAPDWREKMAAWEARVANDQPQWTVLRPEVDDISNGGQKYFPMADGSFLAQGYAPTKHKVKMTVKTDARDIRAFRLELMNDPNLPLGGPGRSILGTGALTEFEVEAAPASDPSKAKPVKIATATADLNLPEKELDAIYFDKSNKRRVTGPVSYAIDGKDETAWGIDAGPVLRNLPRKAVFVAESPVGFEGGTILHIYLKQSHGGWNSDDNQNHNLGRMRVSMTSQADVVADPVPARVREILAIPREKRSAAQEQAVFAYWRTTVAEFEMANRKIASLWAQHPEGSTQLVLNEREDLRKTHVLERGDFLKPKKEIEAGVPKFLGDLPAGAEPGRLGLAKWMVDRKAPTTARAFVNRVWMSYFGTGIVATAEDLGKQSEAPSHPELLDWLAVEFMDGGWSVKHLHRMIVTSSAYRQSSQVSAELLAKDPYNRLISRGPRVRVEGEVVRDIALAASGLLNPAMGGPAAYPPAPDFLFQPPVSYGPKIWKEEKGENRYRRAIYTHRYRSVPYPMLQAFDTPNGDAACVRRTRSNTPLQALTTLNEPLFLEAARALALKSLREGGATDAARIAFAFRRCVSRGPEAKETDELLGLLAKAEKQYAGNALATSELLGWDSPKDVAPAKAAAWTIVARVLLNLDETITKE